MCVCIYVCIYTYIYIYIYIYVANSRGKNPRRLELLSNTKCVIHRKHAISQSIFPVVKQGKITTWVSIMILIIVVVVVVVVVVVLVVVVVVVVAAVVVAAVVVVVVVGLGPHAHLPEHEAPGGRHGGPRLNLT